RARSGSRVRGGIRVRVRVWIRIHDVQVQVRTKSVMIVFAATQLCESSRCVSANAGILILQRGSDRVERPRVAYFAERREGSPSHVGVRILDQRNQGLDGGL